jgi:hypothetical protein
MIGFVSLCFSDSGKTRVRARLFGRRRANFTEECEGMLWPGGELGKQRLLPHV